MFSKDNFFGTMYLMKVLYVVYYAMALLLASVSLWAQNSFTLDLNGLTPRQKVEAYLNQAESFDEKSDIIFLVYNAQRAGELLSTLPTTDITEREQTELNVQLAFLWARIYLAINNLDLAALTLENALPLTNDPMMRLRLWHVLTIVYMQQEAFEAALTISARILSEPLVTPLQRYLILVEQAKARRALNQWSLARESATAALEVAQNILNADGYDAMIELGHIELGVENYTQAIAWWQRTYDAANRQSNVLMMAQAFYLLAELSLRLERWEDVSYYAQRGLLLLAGEEREKVFGDLHYLMARYYLHINNTDLAFTSLRLMHEAQLRVAAQESFSAQLALNLSLIQNDNAIIVNELTNKWRVQRMISIIQMVAISIFIIVLFMLSRRIWEAQAQQRIAVLAYRALTRRVSRSQGTLKVQVASMLNREYSFGLVVAAVKPQQNLSSYPEHELILELILDGLRNQLLQTLDPLEEAPSLQLGRVDHLVLFYFDDKDEQNFKSAVAQLPKNYQFIWQGKPLVMDIKYFDHFYNHDEQQTAKHQLRHWIDAMITSDLNN